MNLLKQLTRYTVFLLLGLFAVTGEIGAVYAPLEGALDGYEQYLHSLTEVGRLHYARAAVVESLLLGALGAAMLYGSMVLSPLGVPVATAKWVAYRVWAVWVLTAGISSLLYWLRVHPLEPVFFRAG